MSRSRAARRLRKSATGAESRLLSRLRGRQVGGAKFRRQHARLDYIVDFFCEEVRLIVEIDGGQHSPSLDVDGLRSRRLRASGCRLMRFWNHNVLRDTDAVVDAIAAAVEERRVETVRPR